MKRFIWRVRAAWHLLYYEDATLGGAWFVARVLYAKNAKRHPEDAVIDYVVGRSRG